MICFYRQTVKRRSLGNSSVALYTTHTAGRYCFSLGVLQIFKSIPSPPFARSNKIIEFVANKDIYKLFYLRSLASIFVAS